MASTTLLIRRVTKHWISLNTVSQNQSLSGDEVIDICSQRQITTQSGYIKSSHYPNNYPATHQCNLTIKAHSSQQIRLYAIDLDLGSVAGNGGNG